MKITLLSPDERQLQAMADVLREAGHIVHCVQGDSGHLHEVAEADKPELVIVDMPSADASSLAQVEHATMSDPALDVVLTCASHSPEFLMEAMRAGVREVLLVPAARPALLGAVDRLKAKRQRSQSRRTGRILTFLSAKGGSGATFLSTNIGWELAEKHTVLLLDMNLQFGDAHAFVRDGSATTSIADVAREVRRLDADLLASSVVKLTPTYSLLPAPENLSEASDVRPDVLGTILNLAVDNYDYVLLDLPRNLDAMGLAALDRASRIYTVLQAGLPDLRHAARLQTTFNSLGYPAKKVEYILNRHQGGQDIDLADLHRTLGDVRIHTVPNDWKYVQRAIASGAAPDREHRDSAIARELRSIAHSITPAIKPMAEASRGFLGRIFKTS